VTKLSLGTPKYIYRKLSALPSNGKHEYKLSIINDKKINFIEKINFLKWYSRKLETHPLITKCLTSCMIAASGDIISQCIDFKYGEKDENCDAKDFLSSMDGRRTGRFAILGFFLVAPATHLWYGFLASRFPGTTFLAVAKRLAVDQVVFAPIFLSTFLSSLYLMEMKSSKTTAAQNYDEPIGIEIDVSRNTAQHGSKKNIHIDVLQRLRSDVPSALIMNYKLWIPALALNFRYVPLKFQVLFGNCVGLIWNGYLSWHTHGRN